PSIGRVTSHTPEKTVLYENLIKMMYIHAAQQRMFGKGIPVHIAIHAFFEPAKSTSKKNKVKMLSGDINPLKKPDIDNIAKVILDALNGTAYYDDTQVIKLEVLKSYDDTARVEVQIKELEE
ncbi:MAG: RusA family crossover junction endodeoxyribonuclease, partial [Anaerovoracaceae bacterium]